MGRGTECMSGGRVTQRRTEATTAGRSREGSLACDHERRGVAALDDDGRQVGEARQEQRPELEAAPAAPEPRPVVARHFGQVVMPHRWNDSQNCEAGTHTQLWRDGARSRAEAGGAQWEQRSM